MLATDEDAQAVARAQANAARNHLPNLEVRQANAFELLRTLEADRQHFDVVVLDPPALAKRQAGDHAALRAYQEIILRGLRLTKPGGLVGGLLLLRPCVARAVRRVGDGRRGAERPVDTDSRTSRRRPRPPGAGPRPRNRASQVLDPAGAVISICDDLPDRVRDRVAG